jgi:hypothetical protein
MWRRQDINHTIESIVSIQLVSFTFEESVPVLDKYKYMSSPNIKNDVTSFRYIWRFGIMDGIIMLRCYSNWPYVHEKCSRAKALILIRYLYSRCLR